MSFKKKPNMLIDKVSSDFSRENNQPKPKYGLPAEIKFCVTCGVSNQRPNSDVEFRHTERSVKKTIQFDDAGVCDACLVAEAKKTNIDWEKREAELRVLCEKFRSRNGKHDCIVPGSGGKDSFYQSWMLKYEYGMNPLTVTWAPNIYTDWGWHNFQAWIHSGMDNFLVTPSGRSKRLLTRLALENLFHPFQPFMLGQKCFAPKMARLLNIPLIFYGEHESEYGSPKVEASSAERSHDYFSSADDGNLFLAGESVLDLKQHFGFTESDLEPYMPIDPELIHSSSIEVHYLGYYVKWHPQSAYYFAVDKGGFTASPERTVGTYSKYNSLDDKLDDFHYYTTFIKFGIGRATSDATQEVRSGDLDLDEAKALIRRYDGEFPERWAEEIFKYLSIDRASFPKAYLCFEHPDMNREYFEALTDKFRSPHIWFYDDGKWQLRHKL